MHLLQTFGGHFQSGKRTDRKLEKTSSKVFAHMQGFLNPRREEHNAHFRRAKIFPRVAPNLNHHALFFSILLEKVIFLCTRRHQQLERKVRPPFVTWSRVVGARDSIASCHVEHGSICECGWAISSVHRETENSKRNTSHITRKNMDALQTSKNSRKLNPSLHSCGHTRHPTKMLRRLWQHRKKTLSTT